jgi:hypothetical protein
MGEYFIGNIVRLTAEFKNEAGAAADPTTVILQIKKPDGVNESNITPTNTAVGAYQHDYTPATGGKYFYKFVGTGGVTAADEDFFIIRGSSV